MDPRDHSIEVTAFCLESSAADRRSRIGPQDAGEPLFGGGIVGDHSGAPCSLSCRPRPSGTGPNQDLWGPSQSRPESPLSSPAPNPKTSPSMSYSPVSSALRRLFPYLAAACQDDHCQRQCKQTVARARRDAASHRRFHSEDTYGTGATRIWLYVRCRIGMASSWGNAPYFFASAHHKSRNSLSLSGCWLARSAVSVKSTATL